MARMFWMMGGAAVLAIGLACGGDITTTSGGLGGGGALSTDGSCPAGTTTSTISNGSRATLVALHPDDAYFDATFNASLPISGVVTGEMTPNDGCWIGGPFEGDDGTTYYFYKGAFTTP